MKTYKEIKIKIGFAYLAIFFVSFAIFGKVHAQDVDMNLFLFGELQQQYNSGQRDVNFRLPDFAIFSLFRFGRVEAFTELALEFELGKGSYSGLYPERFWLGYFFHPLLIGRFGLYHTTIGYFSRKYHHGPYLMTPIRRPVLVEFEDRGGPLPIHLLGIELEGKADISDVKLGYIVESGFGSPHRILHAAEHQEHSPTVLGLDSFGTVIGKLYVKPLMFSEIGLSAGYFPEGGTGLIKIFVGPNFVYDEPGGPEAILEGFFLRELKSKRNGVGGFMIASYPLFKERFFHEIRPYLMLNALYWYEEGNRWFEQVKKFAKDELLGEYPYQSHIGFIPGIKISISPEAVAKIDFEYRIPKRNSGEEVKNIWFIRVMVGFGLPLLFSY